MDSLLHRSASPHTMPHRSALGHCLLAMLLLAFGGLNSSSRAVEALFWISADGTDPGTPGVASFTAAMGIPRQLYIWAQPQTTSLGDWDASTNPFDVLQNISLDVVSPDTTFDIDPDLITVYNPTYSTANPRFGTVSDTTTGLTESDGSELGPYDDLPTGFNKGLLDLQGYSIPSTDGDGFGDVCDASDPYCGTTDDGSPAWLFATFTVTPTADTGSIEFWLQVGRNGMNHAGGSISSTEVTFGVDTDGPSPAAYNADTNRQETLTYDDCDAILSLAGPGDYNADGTVDASDYDVWYTQFGSGSYDADGNGDGTVDLADYTLWRNYLSSSKSLASLSSPAVTVPEPTSTVLTLLACLAGLRAIRLSPSRRSNSGE